MKYLIILAMLLAGCSSGGSDTETTVVVQTQQLTRVAFFGNSITSHPPAPDIGWHGDWGMAASMESLDYVNQTVNMLGAIEFQKFRASRWESRIRTYDLNRLEPMNDYNAEIVVINIGENIKDVETVDEVKHYLTLLINYIYVGSESEVIIINSFYKHKMVNIAIAEFCLEHGIIMVDISDMGVNPAYSSPELFDHKAVGSHPNDAGMLEIAARLVAAINPKG